MAIKRNKPRVMLSMDADIVEKCNIMAKQLGISRSALISVACAYYMKGNMKNGNKENGSTENDKG